MARIKGRHRISRRTKIATGAIGLAMAVGGLVVVTTAGDPAVARADGPDKSLFVDITTVRQNVKLPRQQQNASRGTFTVDCGRNENGHFNPDNFIAQPGVRNGAQHLHDYVGNLSTNADSNNQSLLAAGTTCKNGDKSTYFWPVVRIDREEEEANPPARKQERNQQQAKDKQAGQAPQVDCPDVASQLPDVPDQAQAEIQRNLDLLDTQIDEANKRLITSQGEGGPNFIQNAILGPLKDKRVATIDRMAIAIGRNAPRPQGLERLAPCALKQGGNNQNPGGQLPDENDNNELPGNDGEIQRPEAVELTFRGSPVGKVTAMPKFLRVLYGDAKVSTNGPKNARDSWTCQGFEDRVLINKYPICPQGSKVKRIHDFPSCWDGKNTDSKNHRDHIVYPDQNGKCRDGFKAVPQLRITLTYNIPQDVQRNGQYKVDSFPEEEHNPFSDHDDFANVMSQSIMNRLVNCVNKNKTCKE
ncbi:DUF1996 domain-containing protein [Kibdelosporangium aridum]|uniref:DUF1996 domain-containing protein n=1 Tax=Kibdelosporangium aridum TaxID=2030 RepID=A0A428ZKS6_KIBAR|nr:DUF1996 domain-containing protein [Kibdelosporangium aridum]RSM88675.1 DUF1996 domain-containing protein [Kibdelosporangium aridum]